MYFATALKKPFTDFKGWCLFKIQEQNVNMLTKQLEDLEVGVNAVESINQESPLNILKGLFISSFDGFKDTLQFQDIEEWIKYTSKEYIGRTSTLAQVKVILQEENDI